MDGIVDFPAVESSPVAVGRDKRQADCGSALLGATGLWIKESRPEGRSHRRKTDLQPPLEERFAQRGERLLE